MATGMRGQGRCEFSWIVWQRFGQHWPQGLIHFGGLRCWGNVPPAKTRKRVQVTDSDLVIMAQSHKSKVEPGLFFKSPLSDSSYVKICLSFFIYFIFKMPRILFLHENWDFRKIYIFISIFCSVSTCFVLRVDKGKRNLTLNSVMNLENSFR